MCYIWHRGWGAGAIPWIHFDCGCIVVPRHLQSILGVFCEFAKMYGLGLGVENLVRALVNTGPGPRPKHYRSYCTYYQTFQYLYLNIVVAIHNIKLKYVHIVWFYMRDYDMSQCTHISNSASLPLKNIVGLVNNPAVTVARFLFVPQLNSQDTCELYMHTIWSKYQTQRSTYVWIDSHTGF